MVSGCRHQRLPRAGAWNSPQIVQNFPETSQQIRKRSLPRPQKLSIPDQNSIHRFLVFPAGSQKESGAIRIARRVALNEERQKCSM